MAGRTVHLYDGSDRAGCCGKTMAQLGLGAVLATDPAEVTCPTIQVYDVGPVEGSTLRLRPGDQPLPVVNDQPDVQSALIHEIEERRKLGISRYGTALQPFNGRDSLRDLLDELLDGATYALQVKIERDALLARIAELEAELATVRLES